MRDIKPIQRCLLQLWAVTVGIVLFSFWWTHHTLHSEDWAAMFAIIAWVTVVIHHYAVHILPVKERRNSQKRYVSGRVSGVKTRRT